MPELVLSSRFEKDLQKLIKHSEGLAKQVEKTLKALKKDHNQPSLRLHKLRGKKVHSVSVNKSIRIIVRIKKDRIFLAKIGTHEEVY